jgi:hypothetical protein
MIRLLADVSERLAWLAARAAGQRRHGRDIVRVQLTASVADPEASPIIAEGSWACHGIAVSRRQNLRGALPDLQLRFPARLIASRACVRLRNMPSSLIP